MRYVSLFSGIEAATLAWEPLGWEPLAFAEIEPYPSAVLAERWPGVPNLGDVTKVDWEAFKEEHGSIDLVVGGSPCQSFSIAGKREGLAGASGLMYEYIRGIQELMPRWLVWENVPGALSVEGGRAFEQLLTSLDGLGYGLAWRILDAQFYGVPQRRRRVFLVGHSGDTRACEVLLEPEGMRWDPPTSKQKREALTADARSRPASTGAITQYGDEIAGTLRARYGSPTPDNGQNAVVQPIVMASGQSNAEVGEGIVPTLTLLHEAPVLATARPICVADDNAKAAIDHDLAGSLKVGGGDPFVAIQTEAPRADGYVVRRLTPRECERLQGMPDDHTRIPWRGKPAEECPDGPRYKAMGNSMAVPVMRWIGERIEKEDERRTHGAA